MTIALKILLLTTMYAAVLMLKLGAYLPVPVRVRK
jgi:hypothetical protein